MTTWTSADERVQLFCGDNRDALKKLADNSIDAIVTDPPYALTGNATSKTGFMGEEWDGELPGVDTWKEALRVAKPGAHLLAFGGSRTYHRLACAIEDAGWEIRDCIQWVYLNGFPKSLNISRAFDHQAGVEPEVVGTKLGLPGYSLAPDQGRGVPCVAHGDSEKECAVTAPVTALAKQWEGWGSSLKPSVEPIVLARKPLDGTLIHNVETFGTGGLHIDACRIQSGREAVHTPASDPTRRKGTVGTDLGITRADTDKFQAAQAESVARTNSLGRWPANVMLDEGAAELLDQQTGGSASRVFYCAKPARWERDEGAPSETLSGAEAVHRQEGSKGLENPRAGSGRTADTVRNFHPTVKPVSLMRELVRLVTPPEGIVLDLFMGSGSTGIACVFEGFRFLGVEKEERFFDLAKERIDYAQVKKQVVSKLPTNMLTPKVRPLPPPEEPLPGLGLSKSRLEKLVRKASKR